MKLDAVFQTAWIVFLALSIHATKAAFDADGEAVTRLV